MPQAILATILLISTALADETQLREPMHFGKGADEYSGGFPKTDSESGAFQDLTTETKGGSFNDPKTNSVPFGTVNDPAKAQGGGIGITNFDNKYRTKGTKFGKDGLTVTDLVKNGKRGFESDAQKQVRDLITNSLKWSFEATQLDVQSQSAFWTTETCTCTFPDDDTIYGRTYCESMFHLLEPTGELTSSTTVGEITITGEDIALAMVNVRVSGDLPLIGAVQFGGDEELVVRNNTNGEWQIDEYNLIYEDSDGTLDTLRTQIPMKLLRDSIYFSKQYFPGFSPIAVIGGSAVGGLFAITIVAVWIFRKRSSYKKVNTIVDV